jgi:sulfane dehydrogenase subunit SoxC
MPRTPLAPAGTYRRVPLKPHQLTDDITPTEELFVLAHLGVARVDPSSWWLEVDGMVGRHRRLTMSDLRRFPRREVTSFHECAGNPLTPTVPQRRIANVVWAGVDLRDLLAEVDVYPSATYLWSYGLDHGDFAGLHSEAYVKDLPLWRVEAGDVLVAYEVNGRALPPEHGFPARLLVPGWYGTNSVKWLSRITVADRRFDGPFTTALYNDELPAAPGSGAPGRRPVWEVAPESVIVRPEPGATLISGRPAEVWGRAWAATGVGRVQVSTDGGHTWREAAVGGRTGWSWQRFGLTWTPVTPGPTSLLSRATGGKGELQPMAGARNAVHRVEVTVA